MGYRTWLAHGQMEPNLYVQKPGTTFVSLSSPSAFLPIYFRFDTLISIN